MRLSPSTTGSLVRAGIGSLAVVAWLGLAGATPAAFPPAPKLVTVTQGSVSLGIPEGWKEATIGAPDDVMGCWTIDGFNIFKTSAAILFGKTDQARVRLNLEGLTIRKDTEVTVGGRAARRIDFEDKNKLGGNALPYTQARGIGIILKAPEADGKYLSFLFVSAAEQWDKVGPLFEASIRSIRLDGHGDKAAAGTITTVVTKSGQEQPLAGVTVVIGRRLHLISVLDVPSGDFGSSLKVSGGPIDVVRGEAIFQIGTTNDQGVYRPTGLPPGEYDVVVWKAEHIPVFSLKFTVPGGTIKTFVSPDTGVNAANRHRALNTSKIFSLKPPDPNQPCVWGRITLGTRTTASPHTDPVAGEGVTILVGANLSLKDTRIPSSTDVVQGDALYAVEKTKSDGTFRIPLPPGEYSLIIWKEGYIPQTRAHVMVWPGQVFYTLLNDDQPGNTGRHQELDLSGLKVPPAAKGGAPNSSPEDLWKETDPTTIIPQGKITPEGKKPPEGKKTGVPPGLPLLPVLLLGPPPSAVAGLKDLKELVKVPRIPDFTAAIAYTAYEDRVLLTNTTDRTAVIGVAGRGKAVGAAFRDYLTAEPAVAAVLGEAASLEMSSLGDTLLVQVFEGGTLVKEKASGKVWWNAHSKRPRNLRPVEELTRYPQVKFNNRLYEISTFPERVRIADLAAGAELAVPVGPPGRPIPADFRKVITDIKLEASLGRAVADPAPLFETPARVQVYEGGVVIVEPGTDRFWWCRHTKRTGRPGKPVVTLPKDPNAVVVQLDYVGGYTPPRKTNDPFLRIRADGRVTLIDPFGQLKTVETKISSENLLAFLTFALEENNFFALDTASLERAIPDEAKRGKLPTLVDAPTTVVTIRTADRVHEVRCYAPEYYAEQLPGLKAVQHYQAIHQRLVRYMDALRGP